MSEGNILSMFFPDFLALSKWMEDHHGEYTGLDSFLTVRPASAS